MDPELIPVYRKFNGMLEHGLKLFDLKIMLHKFWYPNRNFGILIPFFLSQVFEDESALEWLSVY